MNPFQNLLGKVICEENAESAEVRLLKVKLHDFVAHLTSEELMKFDEVVDALLSQVQTDSKFDGFAAGLDTFNHPELG